jgi:hypothetical protein
MAKRDGSETSRYGRMNGSVIAVPAESRRLRGHSRTLAQPTGWTLRGCCVRSEAWHRIHVENGQGIEIARMQQLLAECD